MIHGNPLRTTVVIALVLVLTVPATLTVVGGDNVALLYFDPPEIDADRGDEVSIDVVLASHGGYGGEGIGEVEVVVAYDRTVLTVSEVEPGPWLADDDVEVRSTVDVDDQAGSVSISQEREPPADGAKGTAPVATIAFHVAEDATPTNAVLSVSDASVVLVTGHPQVTMDREAVVVIAGGDDEAGSGEEGDAVDGPEGVTLAEDVDVGGETDGTEVDDDPADGANDALGVGLLLVVVGLAVVAALRAVRG